MFNLRGEPAGYSLDIRNSNRLGCCSLEQFALGFSERLVNEMTSAMIEQDCLVEIVATTQTKLMNKLGELRWV